MDVWAYLMVAIISGVCISGTVLGILIAIGLGLSYINKKVSMFDDRDDNFFDNLERQYATTDEDE